jgi:hypothetical protein
MASAPVIVETGKKRVFVSAADWPGWCRSAKDEDGALEMLAAYASRYRLVAALAGVRFPARADSDFEVVERVSGSATTDFGAPGRIARVDREPLTAAQAKRLARLVEAAWARLDDIAATAPASLRKGPRGGGRDRDKMLDHVIDAEIAYARKFGVRLGKPDPTGPEAAPARRGALLDALRASRGGPSAEPKGWPARYAARRIAWHALDHAWEIEDRSD